MAKNRLSSADGEGFLRALTDAWRDAEERSGVTIGLSMFPSARKGVITITLACYEEGRKGDAEAVVRYQCDYPTAHVGTLEACLYQAVIRLERQLIDHDRWPSGRG